PGWAPVGSCAVHTTVSGWGQTSVGCSLSREGNGPLRCDAQGGGRGQGYWPLSCDTPEARRLSGLPSTARHGDNAGPKYYTGWLAAHLRTWETTQLGARMSATTEHSGY